MPERRSSHYTLPASLLTRSPGATRCIFNQGMSALTPPCYRYTHLCRIVISGSRAGSQRSFLSPAFCMLMRLGGDAGACIRLSYDQLRPVWEAPHSASIARDKPIAANKRAVELPDRENVISPSSRPRLPSFLDIFWLGNEVSFKSFHASVLQIGSIYQLTLIKRKYTSELFFKKIKKIRWGALCLTTCHAFFFFLVFFKNHTTMESLWSPQKEPRLFQKHGRAKK